GSDGDIRTVTVSPIFTPIASRNAPDTLSQWPSCPSGSSVAWNVTSFTVPSTVVLPRLGSVSLADFGKTTKAHESSRPGFAGRSSFALNMDAYEFAISRYLVTPEAWCRVKRSKC